MTAIWDESDHTKAYPSTALRPLHHGIKVLKFKANGSQLRLQHHGVMLSHKKGIVSNGKANSPNYSETTVPWDNDAY